MSGAIVIRHSIHDIVDKLINAALVFDDAEQAENHLEEITRSAFWARFAGPKAQNQGKIESIERELMIAEKQLVELRAMQANTPMRKQTAAANRDQTGNDAVEVAFSDWQVQHRIETRILIVLLVTAFGASYVTAFGNLVGTGLPAFIETPAAYFLAAMAPLAGFALKLFGSAFRTEGGQRRFSILLNSVAMAFASSWAVLFALLFHGLSADGIGSGLFDEPTLWDKAKDTLFVGVTLGTEITLGAAMAWRLDRLVRIYSPDHKATDAERLMIDADVERKRAEVEVIEARIRDLEFDLASYEPNLNLQVGMAKFTLNSRRTRLNSFTQL